MVENELYSFGGSVGYKIADFNTFLGAQHFLLKGIYMQEVFPDIWLEMVDVDKKSIPASLDFLK